MDIERIMREPTDTEVGAVTALGLMIVIVSVVIVLPAGIYLAHSIAGAAL
jgi:hypothetical protein